MRKKIANLFLNRIIDGDFFEQKQSEERDYILAVQHCLLHADESYDETFADGLCQMLQKYPKKIEGLQKAMEYLSPKQRETAYYNMMVYIVSAWKMEQDSDVIDYNRFYKVFPFFEKNTVIDRILREQLP